MGLRGGGVNMVYWALGTVDPFTVLLICMTSFLSYVAMKLVTNKDRTKRTRPKCLPSLPLIGSLPFIPLNFSKLPKFFMETAGKLGPIFAFYSGNRYTVVLNGRASLDHLVKKSLVFADRVSLTWEENYTNINMKGLNMHYTDEYKKTRRSTLTALKHLGFGARLATQSRIHNELEALIGKLCTFQGRAFNPVEVLGASLLNVIFGIIFGRRFDHEDPKLIRLSHLIHAFIHNMSMLPGVIPLTRYFPTIQKKFSNIVKAQISIFEILNIEIADSVADTMEDDFVKSYIKAEEEGYCKENLKYVVRDLILAGTDTSRNTLLWAVIMLANNPKVQSSIREEIDAVVPRTRLPSLDDKPNLPYTEASMTELMRWRTLVPLGLPRQTLCDTEVDGLFIPKGTQVLANLYSAHMDPDVWPNPEKFIPERFLDDDGKFQQGNRVIPFSIGIRSCLGEVLARQTIFLFLSALVQNFEIVPPEGQQFIDENGTCDILCIPHPFQIRMIPLRP